MSLSPEDTFVNPGGLPTRITRPAMPEPSPLTRATAAHATAAREIDVLSVEMTSLTAELQRAESALEGLRQAPSERSWTQPLARTRQVAERVAQVNLLLQNMGKTLSETSETIEILRTERGQLQALCVIAEHLNASMTLPDLMTRVLDDLLRLVRADRGAILLMGESGNLRFEAAREASGNRLSMNEYAVSTNIVKQVLSTSQPMVVNDAQGDVANGASGLGTHIHSIMCAPLRIAGKTLGVVYVDRLASGGAFTANHLDLLAAFCNEAAITIENANLFARQKLHMQEINAMRTYTDSILASISSGVMAIDNEGRVTRINGAFADILHIDEASAIDQPFEHVLAVIEDEALHRRITKTIEDPAVRQELLVHAPITGHPRREGASTLKVGWSALHDGDHRRLGTAIVIDDLTDLRQAQHEAEIFRRYVHPDVVDLVTHTPGAEKLGGATREISVVFADLSGYTRLSEELSPAALVDLLNEYLAILTEAVFLENGTVTMFQGDAVMAIFNAPSSQSDHALRAVRAALSMRRQLEQYNQKTGRRNIQFTVGVNTGIAVVGNVGSKQLQNYTAIGDAVNTAKRLEEMANGNQILLGAATMDCVAAQVFAKRLSDQQVKGKSLPLEVWELQGIKG